MCTLKYTLRQVDAQSEKSPMVGNFNNCSDIFQGKLMWWRRLRGRAEAAEVKSSKSSDWWLILNLARTYFKEN